MHAFQCTFFGGLPGDAVQCYDEIGSEIRSLDDSPDPQYRNISHSKFCINRKTVVSACCIIGSRYSKSREECDEFQLRKDIPSTSTGHMDITETTVQEDDRVESSYAPKESSTPTSIEYEHTTVQGSDTQSICCQMCEKNSKTLLIGGVILLCITTLNIALNAVALSILNYLKNK